MQHQSVTKQPEVSVNSLQTLPELHSALFNHALFRYISSDIATKNIANDTDPGTASTRQHFLKTVSELTRAAVNLSMGGIVTSPQAGLFSAFCSFQQEKGATGPAATILALDDGSVLSFIQSSLVPGEYVIKKLNDDLTLDASNPDYGQPMVYYRIDSPEDLTLPFRLQDVHEQNAWLHLDVRLDLVDLTPPEAEMLGQLVSSRKIRSICVDLSMTTGVIGACALYFPKGISPLINAEKDGPVGPRLDTGKQPRYFPSRSAGMLDTSLSTLTPVLHDAMLALRTTLSEEIAQQRHTTRQYKKAYTSWIDEHARQFRKFEKPSIDLCNMKGAVQLSKSDQRELGPLVSQDINWPFAKLQSISRDTITLVGSTILRLNPDSYTGMILETGSGANFKAWQCCQLYESGNFPDRPRKKMLASSLAHNSLELAAPTHVKRIPVEANTLQMPTEELLSSLTDDVAMLALTIGRTQLGDSDCVPAEVIDYCVKHDIWIHLDCCYGLNLLLQSESPFLQKALAEFEQLLQSGAVKSISADLHKLCGYYGTGVLLTTDQSAGDILASLPVPPKSAFGPASACRTFENMGARTLGSSIKSTHEFAKQLADALTKDGGFELVKPVCSGVIALACKSVEEAHNLNHVLLDRGIRSSTLCIQTAGEDVNGIRLVVSPAALQNRKFKIRSIAAEILQSVDWLRSNNIQTYRQMPQALGDFE